MRIHSISTICRKCLMLLALLLASIQMVHAQEESGTTTTETKVYGEGDLIDTVYAGGSGTKDDPWLISNDKQLAKLAHDVTNGNTYPGNYFKLTADIDLKQGKWMPIGTWKFNTKNSQKSYFFAGKLDGDGHSIKNMNIEWTNEDGCEASWGLFSRLKGRDNTEAGFASVTNLIIENDTIQKKPGFSPIGSGVIKLGTIAGDLTQYAEISNIIIRNSKIIDNEETDSTKNSFRVGGVVGYIDNSNNLNQFRIFNISADVDVNMLTKATLTSSSNFQATIAGGFGSVSKLAKPGIGNIVILPRNILIHGSLTTSTNTTRCRKGSVLSSNTTAMDDFDKVYVDDQPITSTWYYTAANKVKGAKDYKYGTEKDIDAIDENTGMTFGKTFVDQINQYLFDKKLDRKSWAYLGNSKFAFSNIKLKFERGKSDVLTVIDEDSIASSDTYNWFVYNDNSTTGTKVNAEACNPFTLPRQSYKQYVYAVSKDGSLRTNTIEVNAIGFTAELDDKTKPGTYIVNVTNDTEEKLSNDSLGLTITYKWYNGIDSVTGSTTTQNEYTPTTTSHKYKYYCKVTVKSGDNILFEKNVCASVIVYLCPAGVTTADGKTYKAGEDNLTDDEWGYSPEMPMLTWQGAYKKLSDKASWDENIIVLMGTSNNDVTKGFRITPNYQGENLLTGVDWENAKTDHPELFRNATITGKWDKDYKGQIEIYGSSRGLPIWGDTRFENITFNNNGGDFYKIIYCQYNNLEMGKGIIMTGFNQNSPEYGTIDGAVTNAFHIFGGINNDGRFYPLNNTKNIQAYEASMPHGTEGFSITIHSGFYSCISASGRQTSGSKEYNGVMGTPNLPIKCKINLDIDREWNDGHNPIRTVLIDAKTEEDRQNDYDVGAILAGSHEGAMYADVDINIKSGKVARVVNGTLGAQREFTLDYGGKTYNVPMNTYMGRASITLDPKNSENNKDTIINNRVIVTELYGGSTGRGHTGKVKVNNPFYGYSTITINGGTFKILPENNNQKDKILCGIFGAGAGGMNGIGYGEANDSTHTPDQSIAYWNDATNRDVMLYDSYKNLYDSYKENIKAKLVTYRCYNTKDTYTVVNPLDTRTEIIINGGIFGTKSEMIDGIYAGGSGYMSPGLWTQTSATPSQYGGNVYGNGQKDKTVSSLTINGGTFYCKNGMFGGGRGTDYFFHENKYGGANYSDYKKLGQTYGNVALNITGGTFYCPIFGGGYGVAYAKEYGKDDTQEILSDMARLYGKSSISIEGGTFYDNVYGGGDMAQTEDTELSISDYADIRGSVFAGGNGREKRDGAIGNPEYIGRVTGSTSLTFSG